MKTVDLIKPTSKLQFDLSILSIEINKQKESSLKKLISEKYGVPKENIEIVTNAVTTDADGNRVTMTSEIIENIQDPKFQQKLFRDYIEMKGIENVDFDAIIDIDNQINTNIDYNTYSKYKNYRIKSLKWDNFLSYGKGNYFDFTDLNGLVLVNAENQQGKTTFCIDLIRFALYGKSDKAPTLEKVFNIYFPNETEVFVEATLEIDEQEYVIRRTITRPAMSKRTDKSKPKQKVEYFKRVGKNLEEINCEAESSTQTNNLIKEAIGSIEDFNLIISANAHTLGDLVRLGDSEKGRIFSRWLGLLTLEEKEKLGKEYYKTKIVPTLISNRYNKATLEEEINNCKEYITRCDEEIKSLEVKKLNSEKIIESKTKEKDGLLVTRKPIDEELCRLDVTTIENDINRKTEEINNLNARREAEKAEFSRLEKSYFDNDAYIYKNNECKSLLLRNGELKGLISNLNQTNANIFNLIQQGICPTCKQPIDVAGKNDEIERNNNQIALYINEGVANKNRIDAIELEIKKLEEDRENVNLLNQIKLKLSATAVNIENAKLSLSTLIEKRYRIEENKENIRINNEIDNKIRIVENEIRMENLAREGWMRDIQSWNNEKFKNEISIKDRNDVIATINKEEVIIRNWNIYNELVGKNGIIKLVLKQSLPIINNEIRRLLSDLCDFEVVLNVNADNKIDISLVRDETPLDLSSGASGFEMTMASIAIRTALAMVSAIAKPNFVVYDEIIGTIHSNNFETFKKLLNRVAAQYQCILHITHAEDIFSIHNTTIKIVKENNVSKIFVEK